MFLVGNVVEFDTITGEKSDQFGETAGLFELGERGCSVVFRYGQGAEEVDVAVALGS